jgi:uncharacterized protein YbjT (DUF2867 family)
MRVLVTGASGFIGAHLVAALRTAGHEVVCGVRAPGRDARLAGLVQVPVSFSEVLSEVDWCGRLEGVDAVVNAAGILRETRRERFRTVHFGAPLALARACAALGIRRFVQVSALGDPRDGAFVASKHEFDRALGELDLDWVVLRPGFTYAVHGSYGGSSLLRALAALPIQPLPGGGTQQVQPLAMDDLCAAVVAASTRDAPVRQVLELAGPEVLTLRAYLARWRAWLGFAPARALTVPAALVRLGAWLGERLGRGPVGLTMWRMLQRGQVATPGALARAEAALEWKPRPLEAALAAAPAQVQDRWQARLYFLAPLLRISLALVWIGSGVAGLLASPEAVHAMLAPLRASGETGLRLAFATSTLDLVLGAWLLLGWRVPLAATLALICVLAYTIVLGVLAPALWLDLTGGLLKNLALIPALLVLRVLMVRR